VYEDLDALIKSNLPQNTLDDHSPWNDGKPGDPAERNKSDTWKAALQQARSFGRVPAGIARQLEDVLHPKRDWRDLLRDGLFFPEDYQWVPTDRRFNTVLLPTLTGEIHRVVVAIDTSGSIQGAKLAAFWTELVAILRNNRCEARVLTCDAEIQDEFDELQFDPTHVPVLKGGGGTSFVPVFDRVERYVESGWRPEALVYLTDLDGSFPTHAPDLRTLWIVSKEDESKKAPFGEVIVLE
jgi:predicted metal-dependent peptidase